MEDFKAENPHLVAFLEERLPQLGLDGETYGTYVLGTSDEEELQQVMELLQASCSEEQDASVWETLTKDIQSKMKLDQDLKHQKELEQKEHQRALLEEQLAQAKQGIQQETANATNKQHHASAVDEATKQALLSRYAYEQDDEDEEGEEESEAPLTNREVAAQASQEKAKELKSAKVATKREEQQKTKEQKASKQQLKEERRKRAQKGERKR
jgi:hypothetical protein